LLRATAIRRVRRYDQSRHRDGQQRQHAHRSSVIPATDKAGIRFAASTLFVDRLPVDNDTPYGFIRFAGDMSVTPLTDISDAAARESVREAVNDRSAAATISPNRSGAGRSRVHAR
jgi:hypothetical protein